MSDHEQRNLTELSVDNEEPLDVPSCINSLSSSIHQLHQLSREISRYYIKILLCYGHTSELNNSNSRPVSPGDNKSQINDHKNSLKQRNLDVKKILNINEPRYDPEHLNEFLENSDTLNSMDYLSGLLPFLNDLSSFIERCFATIESTFKRLIYHLNKGANRLPTNHLSTDDEFQLPPESKLNPIFMALMDLIFGLVNLDKVVKTHTNISDSLIEFRSTCELVIEAQANHAQNLDHDLLSLSPEQLTNLVKFIGNIQLTLCNETHCIFELCVEHLRLWNLILDKSQKGHECLCKHFEEFILFYIENMIEVDSTLVGPQSTIRLSPLQKSHQLLSLNLTQTLYMTSGSRKVFGLCSLFTLYCRIFEKSEKRITKAIVQLLQRSSTNNIVHVPGTNCYLMLDKFLIEHLPKSLLDSRIIKQLADRGAQLLKSDVSQTFDKLSMLVMSWSVSLKAETLCTNPAEMDMELLKKRIQLIQRGFLIAEEINDTIKTIMMTYLHNNKPMAKNNLISVLRLVCLIKSIEINLTQSKLNVHYCTMQIEHLARVRWIKLLDVTRKRLISLRHTERKIDTSSAMLLTQICSNFDYLTTYESRIPIILCLSLLVPALDSNELGELNQIISTLIPDIYERLESCADCGYVYWSYPNFGIYYNHAFEEDPCALDELNFFHSALNDIPKLFAVTSLDNCSFDLGWLTGRRDEFLAKLGKELMEQFQSDFLDKICQELEIELRLQSHRDLHLDDNTPFKRHLYNFKQIFASSRYSDTVFRILDETVSMRYYIEQHLNKICYNLTSIAPHDWFTYDNMLNLARHRYDLKFVNSLLPTQTLDCGLDLIDLTRNLALFITRYGYDLVNQLFIEKCSNRLSTSSASSTFSGGGMSMLSSSAPTTSNQLLNVVQIKHIEGSIQTHGYGLLSSSVNCTYQVLRRIINLLSKQLADDTLRATLTKELQLFEQSHSSAANINAQCSMTFEKANKMAKRFKANTANLSEATVQSIGIDLDSLRHSITQIGNLLAFIRMLKGGALNCASKSVDYLPNLDDLSNLRLTKFVQDEFHRLHSDSLKRGCENFDQCLADLEDNFSPNTNYFNVIVQLFSHTLSDKANKVSKAPAIEPQVVEEDGQDTSEQRQQQQADSDLDVEASNRQTANNEQSSSSSNHKSDHLKLFFLLVPALTINYIDHIITCKERVSSRSSAARFGGLISDDGFSMGVAFLLTVLNQTKDFSKIDWFKQVNAKLELYKNEVRQRIEGLRYEESLKQTSSMTLGRLNRLDIEYAALKFTLSSALLFFRSSTLATSS